MNALNAFLKQLEQRRAPESSNPVHVHAPGANPPKTRGSERDTMHEHLFTLPERAVRLTYAFPWPNELPGFGRRSVGPFDQCTQCEAWSWVRYGKRVLCLRCSRQREAGSTTDA